MIIVRDIFQVQFGRTHEAIELWKQARAALANSGYGGIGSRFLSDLAGTQFYTIIMESTFDSLAQWEQAHEAARSNAQWRAIYQKLIPLIHTGHREILTVVSQ